MTKPITNAEQLARALGGKRAGRQFVACCPAHADSNPSLIIYDGHTAPQVRCLAGCHRSTSSRCLPRLGCGQLSHLGTVDAPHDDAEAKRNADLALMIWQDALDAAGTPAEAYLWPRGLCLPADRSALRFHPRCPRGRDRQPALVAAMCPLKSSAPGRDPAHLSQARRQQRRRHDARPRRRRGDEADAASPNLLRIDFRSARACMSARGSRPGSP